MTNRSNLDRNDRAVNINLAFKVPCRVATDANVTLSGLQTIDGHTLVEGERVLCTGQTDATTNGIYVATSGLWYRAPDSCSNRDLRKGCRVIVTDGALYDMTEWLLTSDNPHIIDVSNQTWEQYCQSASATGTSSSGYKIYLFDDCCHLYTSLDSGATWVETGTPSSTLGDDWIDMVLAVNDGDYDTLACFDLTADYPGFRFNDGTPFTGAVGVTSSYTDLSTCTMLNFTNGDVVNDGAQQLAISGAITDGAQTILVCPSAYTIETGTLTNYPRLSKDSGETWSDVTGLASNKKWTHACFSQAAATMYIYQNLGHLWRSDDGADTWTELTNGPVFHGDNEENGVRIRCSQDGTIIAGMDGPDHAGTFWLSQDSGETWPVAIFEFTALAGIAGAVRADFGMTTDGKTLVAGICDDSQSYVYVSTDTAANWTAVTPPSAATKKLYNVNISPDGLGIVVVYDNGTSEGIADVSTDGGDTWTTRTFTLASIGDEAITTNGVFVSAYIVPNS